MPRKKNYVGVSTNSEGTIYERFLSDKVPTQESHGKMHACVIGPFHTKLGALVCVHAGINNPHTQNVAACEKIARMDGTREEFQGKPDRRFYPVS